MVSLFSMSDLERALRATRDREHVDIEGRAAAVSAIFRESPRGLEVLFIRRANRDGDPWSGHMAFPGGRRDPADPDLLATALRETREEVGLHLDRELELVGRLDDQDTSHRHRAGFLIRPFVFRLASERARDVELVPNALEVDEIVWAPIAPMLRGEIDSSIEVSFDNVRYTLPAWDIGGRTVWGLTYRMLQDVFGRVRGHDLDARA